MEYFARSVDAVMKKAGVRRAVLVGHSMGTPVARQFYRLYPERTLGIVVVDGALARFAPRETMLQFLEPLKQDFAKNAGGFVDGMLTPIKDDSLKKLIRETMTSARPHVAISAWEAMADERIWTEDKVNIPVLALMAHSPFWPPEMRSVYSSIAPNIDYQVWDGVSHFLMMEKPAEFNRAVEGYIQKHRLL
jgi:pimeloyl-ACP methyl ester carboxylesterase